MSQDGHPTGPARLAVKISPDAHKKQENDPAYLAGLIQGVGGYRDGLVPRAKSLFRKDAVLAQKIAQAVQLDPSYRPPNFDAWYQVEFVASSNTAPAPAADENPSWSLPEEALKLIHRLHELEQVESVHALREGPPPAVDPTDDPRSRNQGYLNAAPTGIDARYAWGFPGGDGAGAHIVDIEQGWNLNHEDLAAAGITLVSGTNEAWFDHGTSVLGELFMVDNQLGGVGIVPAAKGRVISQFQPGGYSTPAAIVEAIKNMTFGQILLLELQEYDSVGGAYFWPAEVADANFDAIRLATALGITVVQAGCNGSYDLDAYTNLSGKHIFNRSVAADYRESGAIMVGGATSVVPHSRMWFSNFGSRVDVYAWGENVDTATTDRETGTNNTLYTGLFNGTSSASPNVAGAAAAIQGLAKAALGYQFSPLQVRQMLITGGTPSRDPPTDRIGVMPNLRAIIDGPLLNLTPDLFIRDWIGDTGSPHTHDPSASPDIIVRQTPLANPQAALGPGSGTESDLSLSQPVVSGQNHYLYVRIQNRGGAAASTTRITVYYTHQSTALFPPQWHVIGTATLPAVPAGRVLTVSPRIDWPAAAVPGTGHYCFIAVADSAAGDPAPAMPTSFPAWRAWVQANNNVAWRNFNIIAAPPSSGTHHRFPIRIPGAFDAARRFAIRTVGSLPRESEVRFEIPVSLARNLGVQLQPVEGGQGNVVAVPLHPFAKTDVGEGVLPVDSLALCTLVVRVPNDVYTSTGDFEFAVLQLFEGEEIGRVTYRFGQITRLR